jgi:hypothetical protein
LKKLGAGVVAACCFLFAGGALSAGSYSDPIGDNNAAPDITSVSVSETAPGILGIAVAIGNYQTLPENSWLNIWFDTDSNQATGDAGDEALVRYLSDGSLQLYRWNGASLVAGPTVGVTATFTAGALVLSVPESAVGAGSSFGILAVSARGQELAGDVLVASDYAPDNDRSAYVGPAAAVFPDPAGDHDAAPDISSIRVTDAKNGWVSFAIATPNYVTLPAESLVGISIDADNVRGTGDAGADVRITLVGGEFELERWSANAKRWVSDSSPTRVRSRNTGGVVTIDVHRSELGGRPRLGFSVVTADINSAASSILGFDLAPDDARFFTYAFTYKAALTLESTGLSSSPSQPRAGKPVVLSLAVQRSDTGRGIASGTIACRVLLNDMSVPAKGSVAHGSGRCALVLPASAKGKLLHGTITVRSSGSSVARNFRYRVQ